MKVLIIEDELYTAKDLQKTILQVAPEAEILEVIPSVEEGIEFLQAHPEVDLIFSDIQLNDGLSFEIFAAVSLSIPIVFCTAFNQYALEAFQTYGIDYVLKPFDVASVGKALQKYRDLKQRLAGTGRDTPDLTAIAQAITTRLYPQKATSIIVHKGDKIIPMPIDEIALFYIHHESVWAYTFKQEKYVLNTKLDSLEEAHSPTFFRANRQQLIHRQAVRDAEQYFKRKLLVHLKVPFEDEIVVGKLKVKPFLEWLSRQ